jgi:putative membrane protein
MGDPLTTPGATPAAGNVAPTIDTSKNAGSLDNAQVAAVVQAANAGEIAQAREALKRAKSARVRQFAQHMLRDHSAAEAEMTRLDSKEGWTPESSAIAEQLKMGSEQIMTNLRSAGAADFDSSYINAQVDEHTKVVDLLDNKLIPGAKDADLVKTLQEIRTKVAMHLNDAREIQTSLGQKQMKIPFLRPLSLSLVGLGLCMASCERDEKRATTRTTSGSVLAADDTKINERDLRDGATAGALPTPRDQANDLADLSVTQPIRKALISDDSLSSDAKNVKIITANGVVTLRGPVKSAAERATIASKAHELSLGNRVDNQIEVEAATTH